LKIGQEFLGFILLNYRGFALSDLGSNGGCVRDVLLRPFAVTIDTPSDAMHPIAIRTGKTRVYGDFIDLFTKMLLQMVVKGHISFGFLLVLHIGILFLTLSGLSMVFSEKFTDLQKNENSADFGLDKTSGSTPCHTIWNQDYL
jgi:hypothetical protein